MKAKSDNIILQLIDEKVSEKIYVPTVFRDKMMTLKKGIVLSAGPGLDRMPMPVKAGDTVVFGKNNGFTIDYQNKKYHAIKLHHLIAAK